MSDGHGPIREIAWREIFPWLILVRALRLALSPRVLILGAVALVGVTVGWQFIGEVVFSGTNDPKITAWTEIHGAWPWQLRDGSVELALPAAIAEGLRRIPLIGEPLVAGQILGVWYRLSEPFIHLFHADTSWTAIVYLLLIGLWAIVVWALFGGAITRIAALELSREESLGMRSAVAYASSKWPSYFSAPLFPLLAILVPSTALGLGGLLLWWSDSMVLVAGLLWPLVLLAGLFLAIVLIVLLVGWPLLWPTISTEGTDAFDALSRAYAYVLQRPFHYLFYIFVASVLGMLGALLVDALTIGVVSLGQWAVGLGAGVERMEEIRAWVDAQSGRSIVALDPVAKLPPLTRAGVWLIALWQGAITSIRWAFHFGFFWTAASAIYLLLRRDVDATEFDEVALDEEDDASPLPPLPTAATATPEADVAHDQQTPADDAQDPPADSASP